MNIFELDSPDQYVCSIWKYRADMSLLVIELTLSLKRLRVTEAGWKLLFFQGVMFVQCPKIWTGANFSMASDKDGYNVYTVNTSTMPIKIIAQSATAQSYDWIAVI